MKRTALVAALLGLLAVAGCGTPKSDVHVDRGREVGAGDVYVALGDSYSAGPDIGEPSGPVECQQSDLDYPHLLATDLALDLHDRTCSGARTSDLAGRQEIGSARIAPQLDGLSEDTSLVTLGIGGNDESIFGNLILSCVQMGVADPEGSPCADAAEGQEKRTEAYRKDLEDRIVTAVGDISERAPHARVVLVGYPQVFPEKGRCAQLPLAAGDIPFARSVVEMLNTALRSAADRTQADYVDTWHATAGHDICSKDPWIAGLHPVHPAMAFHPYAAEQRVVARLIAKALAA